MPSLLSRRDLLKLSAAGVLGGSAAPWFEELARAAASPARSTQSAKSCILMWMGGGPSQTDTFDMKPGTPSAGEFRPIATRVPGIQICEHLPRLARQMDKLALLRSMSTGEADHHRATYYLQTGYKILPGTSHPLLGSVVSNELGPVDDGLPGFFWLGGHGLIAGGGPLGARHSQLHVAHVQEEAYQNLPDLRPANSLEATERQLGLLDRLEDRFIAQHHGAPMLRDHRTLYQQGAKLMWSGKISALELKRESRIVREMYGDTPFGRSALLARRLVEVGVHFVGLSFGDWDTHQDNWPILRRQLPEVDKVMSALLTDLESRGLLDSTLVVWMGEFGRDPQINGSAKPGREHFARAWTTVVAGAGLKTGQVVGRTSKLGDRVEERPITTADFMATLCRALGIDYTKENNTPEGRPLRIADKGAQVVEELF